MNESTLVIFCRDIWVPQEMSQLWLSCVKGAVSFEEAASSCDYNLESLMVKGFNANFLDRRRWFDVRVMQKLNLVGQNLRDFACKKQINSWKLTREEKVRLGLRKK